MGALAAIDAAAEHRDGVEQRIDRAQWAEVLAEGAEDRHACDEHRDEQRRLPREQPARGAADALVRDHQRQAALQRACGAEQLAEPRRALPGFVLQQQGQREHQHGQHRVLDEPQRAVAAEGVYLPPEGDFVQQLLYPPKGAEPAADKAPRQRAHQQQKARHIIGKPEFPAAQHRLQRADGAGAHRAGAGIAVEPGHAQALQAPLVQRAARKARKMAVGQQRPCRLHRVTHPFHFLHLIQCRYTPDTRGSPC